MTSEHGRALARTEVMESIYGIAPIIPIQFLRMLQLRCAHYNHRTIATGVARKLQRSWRPPLSVRRGQRGRERPLPACRGSDVHRQVPPATRSRSVTGNHALRGQGAEFADDGQPAAKTAVQHRYVADEHKIACKQCPGLLVEHGQVVIAVRGRPALSVRVRAPRSNLRVPSTSKVGGTRRTSSISSSPMMRRNASM